MATKTRELELLADGQGCLAGAADDEPVFILRAQDRLAPLLVHLWSQLADLGPDGPCPKTLEARALAGAMTDWQRRNWTRVKWPD